jgi:hypothetical protein
VRLRLFLRLVLSLPLCVFLCQSVCLLILSRLSYDPVGLMSMLCGQLTMPLQYFLGRKEFFTISGAVCSDLRSSRAIEARLTEMVFDLFAARA